MINLLLSDGDWKVAHSLALFEEDDVLCVSDREGERVDCVRAGVNDVSPMSHLNADQPDQTGVPVVTYKGVGRTYAIAAKGMFLYSLIFWDPFQDVRAVVQS